MKDIALIFPGQGAQKVGMGKEFFDASPEAKEIFNQADQVVPGLSDVIFNGPQEKLTSTAYCQPAILTMSIAALKALEAHENFKNVTPKFSAGLSLGEYSALAANGALSFEDTVKLVERRSTFMDEATKQAEGKMAAIIGLDKEKILEICEQTGAEVANFNSPQQIVITGYGEKVVAAAKLMEEAGAKNVIMLEVAGAFHSTLMVPAAEKFAEEVKKFNIKEAAFAVVSNVDARPVTDQEVVRANLAKQITSSVEWVASVEYIARQGVDTFIEIGPGSVLKGLIRRIDRGLTVYNIQTPEDLEKLSF